MKKINNFLIQIIFVASMASMTSYSQTSITRGAEENEIYIATDWYHEGYNTHYGIFYSSDNGENLELMYENILQPPPGEMRIMKLIGDAAKGVLYNYSHNINDGLYVSFDYGLNWIFIENCFDYIKYFSGALPGIIFKGAETFFKSIDYGFTFRHLPVDLTCRLTEVGFIENEFFGITGEPGVYFDLIHTLNFGQTYTQILIDSTVALHTVGGYWPEISRGTQAGEIYLVSWWPDYHYKIFHSVDTGYTWSEQFESGYIDNGEWRVQYTAGSALGSFYVLRTRIDPVTHNHILLSIDYSRDYGKTFSTYFHDLTAPVGINEIRNNEPPIKAFPNPFDQLVTFELKLPERLLHPCLEIFDINNHPIIELNLNNETRISWDGCDRQGNRVGRGIYFYRVTAEHYHSPLNKVILVTN